MDSYKIDIVRDRDLSKQFRFTNRDVTELTKNNKGKTFIVTIKVKYLSVNKTEKFTSNPRKIKNKSSARKILTEANREILSHFNLDNYKILKHEIDYFTFDSEADENVVITKYKKALK